MLNTTAWATVRCWHLKPRISSSFDDKAVIPVLLYLFRASNSGLTARQRSFCSTKHGQYLQHELFSRPPEGLAEDHAPEECRRGDGDATNQRHRQFRRLPMVVLENCPTKILLPNAESKNPGSREFYNRVGLNERELEILQISVPKQHYYVVSKLGRRLVIWNRQSGSGSWVGLTGRERTPDC